MTDDIAAVRHHVASFLQQRPGPGEILDQLIVNAAGARLSHRRTAGGNQPIPLDWPAAAVIGDDRWTAEFAIPLQYLDLQQLHVGRLLEIKFGREDYTGADVALSVWPSGAEYAGLDGYGRLYLGEPNLLADVKVDNALSANLDLLPLTPYLLTAQIRADHGDIQLRADGNERRLPASGAWQPVSLAFATGTDGRVAVTAGGTGAAPGTAVRVRQARLVQISRIPALGPAIRAGGFATRNKYNRSHAVSWSGFGTDCAALVLEASATRFRALLYNFATVAVDGHARFWSLDAGQYILSQSADADDDHHVDSATGRAGNVIISRGRSVAVRLPPQQVTVVELTLLQAHGNTQDRADLALSPLDTEVAAGVVRGVAHNIALSANMR